MLIKVSLLGELNGRNVFEIVGTGISFFANEEQLKNIKNNSATVLSDLMTAATKAVSGTLIASQPEPAPVGQGLLPLTAQGPAIEAPEPAASLGLAAQPAQGTPREAPGTEGVERPAHDPQPIAVAEENPLTTLLKTAEVNKNLPYKLNDDAEPVKQVLTTEVAAYITETWEGLDSSDKTKIAEKLARVKVQHRVKFKDKLPQQLKHMISTVVISRDGPARHLTPSEAAFLGNETPDFGLNKKTPLASIPEDFGEAAPPQKTYRSPAELMSMLSGDPNKQS